MSATRRRGALTGVATDKGGIDGTRCVAIGSARHCPDEAVELPPASSRANEWEPASEEATATSDRVSMAPGGCSSMPGQVTGAAPRCNEDVRRAIVRYIETWYNPKRRHSTLGDARCTASAEADGPSSDTRVARILYHSMILTQLSYGIRWHRITGECKAVRTRALIDDGRAVCRKQVPHRRSYEP